MDLVTDIITSTPVSLANPIGFEFKPHEDYFHVLNENGKKDRIGVRASLSAHHKLYTNSTNINLHTTTKKEQVIIPVSHIPGFLSLYVELWKTCLAPSWLLSNSIIFPVEVLEVPEEAIHG